MLTYFVKNDKCYKRFFRAWIWSKDKTRKIFPKKSKAFPISIEVPCHFCDICMS